MVLLVPRQIVRSVRVAEPRNVDTADNTRPRIGLVTAPHEVHPILVDGSVHGGGLEYLRERDSACRGIRQDWRRSCLGGPCCPGQGGRQQGAASAASEELPSTEEMIHDSALL